LISLFLRSLTAGVVRPAGLDPEADSQGCSISIKDPERINPYKDIGTSLVIEKHLIKFKEKECLQGAKKIKVRTVLPPLDSIFIN